MKNEGNKNYSSFEELASDFVTFEKNNRTKNVDKLKKQQEKFLGRCKSCGQLLSWIRGTNIVACQNAQCKGIKSKNSNDMVPVFRVLDEKGLVIAQNLFHE